MFPYYLSLGMTYKEYWEMDSHLVISYRKADDLKRKRENERLWLQGMYFYDALCRVSPLLHAFNERPEAIPYPDRPYPLSLEEAEAIEKEKEIEANKEALERFKVWADSFNGEEGSLCQKP